MFKPTPNKGLLKWLYFFIIVFLNREWAEF